MKETVDDICDIQNVSCNIRDKVCRCRKHLDDDKIYRVRRYRLFQLIVIFSVSSVMFSEKGLFNCIAFLSEVAISVSCTRNDTFHMLSSSICVLGKNEELVPPSRKQVILFDNRRNNKTGNFLGEVSYTLLFSRWKNVTRMHLHTHEVVRITAE